MATRWPSFRPWPVAEAGTVTYAAVTDAPIGLSDVMASVGSPSDGAQVLFVGAVRNHADGRPVTGVLYEAYREMAEKVLSEIVDEALALTSGGRVAAVHRVGELSIGEASVAIAVSSAHRADAYRASRHVIEAIKERLPVWKHERYADGSEEWVAGVVPGAKASPTSVTT